MVVRYDIMCTTFGNVSRNGIGNFPDISTKHSQLMFGTISRAWGMTREIAILRQNIELENAGFSYVDTCDTVCVNVC